MARTSESACHVPIAGALPFVCAGAVLLGLNLGHVAKYAIPEHKPASGERATPRGRRGTRVDLESACFRVSRAIEHFSLEPGAIHALSTMTAVPMAKLARLVRQGLHPCCANDGAAGVANSGG